MVSIDFSPGMRIIARDEEWTVKKVESNTLGSQSLHCVGVSPLVKEKKSIFITELERIDLVDPAATKLVADDSPFFRKSRLYMESQWRQQIPTDPNLHIGDRAAMDALNYQLEPASLALGRPRQRILIADTVGLGKTLEAGILVSELMLRGKGKRILVVTVKSMMLQFQKEFWNRFSIPLVRLDSGNIQRVRAKLPSNHNPFFYYDKTIISIDTLKRDVEYRTHLENATWDIIIIDEAHNVADRCNNQSQSQRARLAKLLAGRSDTLILLSATPHDGRSESFASLMNMLDPTAIADIHNYTKKDIQGLCIRRFKKDIQNEVHGAFKERRVSTLQCQASPAEERAYAIFADMKLDMDIAAHHLTGTLFKTSLEKSLFSSPAACIKSIEERLKKLEKKYTHDEIGDIAKLREFKTALDQIDIGSFSRYTRLVELLKSSEYCWSANKSDDRIVIFTERIETMRFLASQLRKDLRLSDAAVPEMYGGMSDSEQQQIVEDFGREDSPIRILVASDVASEGINLHYLCHRLIHFDIPWSLMVFQQRNGRIDRYGQREQPDIRYFLINSKNTDIHGDTRILMLVDVDEEHDISKAFSMNNDEFTFGYEFVRKATMREINFGESDVVGEKLLIAGVDDIRRGFKICKYCGKIQPESGKPVHTFTCKAKNMPADSSDPFEECLFLYREFTTEAIRILVPATTMDSSNVRQESFTAAFMLGMRKYFGNVDHLRACISEVPVKDADYRKQYLVIYDSVPGGTGYLKQLLQHENALIEVFEKALEVLENCSCKEDPQKDGCYHCLYAYRQSQKIGQISRRVAIELLKTILSGKENVEEIPCLSNIPVNSLFESELERRFVEALDRMRTDSRPITITKELVNNKEGYRLKIRDSIWEIEPQVYLDASYDVAVPSKPDFVIWPIRGTGDQKPVAVFTDGFLYHKDIVADDTLKREAIRRSGRFRVFSLSWKDVESVFHVQNEYATATLLPHKMPSGSKVYQPTIMNGHAESIKPDVASPMELLVKYLELSDAERVFSVHATAYAISLLDMSMVGKASAFNEWHQLMEPVLSSLAYFDDDYVLEDTIFGKWLPRQSNACLKVLAGVGTTDMRAKRSDADYRVIAVLSDGAEGRTDKYAEEWNGFWQFFNVMQYLPGFAAVSTTGIDIGVYHALPITLNLDVPVPPIGTDDTAWAEALEQTLDATAKAMAEKMIELGMPAPSIVGFELTDESGEVIAEAEMAWEAQKIAFLLPEQPESTAFEAHGWLVLTADSELTKEIFDGRSAL